MTISNSVKNFISKWEEFSKTNNMEFSYNVNEVNKSIDLKFSKNSSEVNHSELIFNIEYLMPIAVNQLIYMKLENL